MEKITAFIQYQEDTKVLREELFKGMETYFYSFSKQQELLDYLARSKKLANEAHVIHISDWDGTYSVHLDSYEKFAEIVVPEERLLEKVNENESAASYSYRSVIDGIELTVTRFVNKTA